MSGLLAGMSVQVPPLLLGTATKHFLSRKKVTKDSMARDEFLYDQAFVIVKTFLETATRYPVEELQSFSNTRIPAPPTVTSIRLLIPMSCCDEAAAILIAALGGEEKAKEIAGGTRWWQVRGLPGIDANWIANKKEWNRDQRKRTSSGTGASKQPAPGGESPSTSTSNSEDGNDTYTADMDPMRCMLFFHGGGYFFGSTDQERFCVQRYARKMNGRVFAVNYRLAPQYPFPCPIQDAIAAYLYLINPPPGALHKPVPPSQIIINGDSAGGNLVLALLQVIRDANLPAPINGFTGTKLPMPGGAILVSPWCDLTHSFPSTVENTATDVIPRYGLSIYKPSALWPPPPDDVAHKVRSELTEQFRNSVRRHTGVFHDSVIPGVSDIGSGSGDAKTTLGDTLLSKTDREHAKQEEKTRAGAPPSIAEAPTHASGAKKPVEGVDYIPTPTVRGEPIRGTLDGKVIEVSSQIQLYAMNHQLTHPLISSVNAYLGGLCPLFIMASDKEVIRDEIIFVAHRAANPDKYPLKEGVSDLYPAYNGIEKRYAPTDVHLQIYDETCHVLPLFTFTTPAVYSYRAMAAFCKFVTKPPTIRSPTSGSPPSSSASPSTAPAALAPVLSPTLETMVEEPAEIGNADGLGSQEPFTVTEIAVPPTPSGEVPKSVVEGSEVNANASLSESSFVSAPDTISPPAATPNAANPVTECTPPRPSVSQSATGKGDGASAGPGLSRRTSVPTLRRLSTSMFRRRRASEASGVSSIAESELPEEVQPWARNKSDFPDLETHGTKSTKGYAGHARVYADVGGLPFTNHMLRERVATNGQIRPLEDESKLTALNWPTEMTCVITEPCARRYLEGQAIWDQKYAKTAKKVAVQREKQIRQAQKETEKLVAEMEARLKKNPQSARVDGAEAMDDTTGHALLNAPSFSWAWALEGENPPPSSLVARRDTAEARRLARLADIHLDQKESRLSGNNLWTIALDLLGDSSTQKKRGEGDSN